VCVANQPRCASSGSLRGCVPSYISGFGSRIVPRTLLLVATQFPPLSRRFGGIVTVAPLGVAL
jgi:hypothetical protein